MGGGSGPINPSDISALEEKAKKVLGQGDKKNVFISFSYEDIDEVNLLRGQAKNQNSDLEFSDWSVREAFNSERAEYIKKKISERIERCSVTLVYLTENSAQSDWVNWEITKSIELGKGVVCVHKHGENLTSYPKSVTENNLPVVAWNHEALNSAIAKASSES